MIGADLEALKGILGYGGQLLVFELDESDVRSAWDEAHLLEAGERLEQHLHHGILGALCLTFALPNYF
jgi:hypothetical protein